jgi:hypothetical protein
VQRSASPNRTGLPDGLKAGVENLSGHAMDDVRVHYNSSKPAQLNALAYTQGRDIHVAAGQERHLPHEAWHVVQQAQGRVRPTRQMKSGVPINDDSGLEREADLMGAKAARNADPGQPAAVESKAAAAASTVQRASEGKVVQLVLATVNPQNGPVNLAQVGAAPAFLVMQNAGQPVGNAVASTVGFTGVLNEGEWANLGNSPADFWRAHGYAQSFGGAGDGTNVGWWRESAETEWTGHEQRVLGADGQAQIAAWQPGVGETGTYLVERDMHAAVTLKPRYVTPLTRAAEWGFDDARPAWVRAEATCDTIFPMKERQKRLVLLRAQKQLRRGQIAAVMQNWINNLFGTAPNLETNLIQRMKMTYTITAPGVGPGASRADLAAQVSSAKPTAQHFGLKDQPADLWEQLVNHNVGMFGEGNAPILNLNGTVPYAEVGKPAQQFRAYDDGWGVPL